jgi:predicted PurR-regulated permease PerM
MWDTKLFKAGVAILLLFLIILVGSQITFVFQPFIIAFEVLFIAFLIAGALYYIMAPLVDWLTDKKVPRPASIVLTYLLYIGVITLLVILIGPSLQAEFTALVIEAPDKANELLQTIEGLEDVLVFSKLFDLQALSVENITNQITGIIENALMHILTSITYLVNLTTSILITIFVVPFLLYYMLIEKGRNSVPTLVNDLAPREYAPIINHSLTEMNHQLASYVQGLGIVCFLVGVLSYIGFVIIGLDFALVLAIFVMITNIVPIIGPFIGAIPAAIVGLIDSPLMMLKVIIVIVIIQQADAMLIRPQIVGRKMAMSPLAIILIVIVAGRLGGLMGIILAVPIFTVIKIISARIYEYIQIIREKTD